MGALVLCRDMQVFGGTGWTVVRARATVDEGVGKIREGFGFFTRGVRLLGSDVSSAGRLFYRAGAGASLKPREVQALGGVCSCLPCMAEGLQSILGDASWLDKAHCMAAQERSVCGVSMRFPWAVYCCMLFAVCQVHKAVNSQNNPLA